MKTIFQIAYFSILLLALDTSTFAKDWRGIVPFHSTRNDVTKLLGQPSRTNWHDNSTYHLENEEVFFVFSDGLDISDHPCIKHLSNDTVMLIQVRPKTVLKLSDLQIDETRYRKFDPSYSTSLDYEGYIDNEEGIVIRTFKGKIDEIDYVAAKKDRNLCPSYSKNPEDSIQIIVEGWIRPLLIAKFSSSIELKSKLDNLYSELIAEPTTKGVFINYGTKKELARRAVNIQKIIKSKKYDLSRIYIINVNTSKIIKTEIFIVPVGAEMPVPDVSN